MVNDMKITEYAAFRALRPHFKLLAITGCLKLTVDAKENKVSHYRWRQVIFWTMILIYNLQHVIQAVRSRQSVEKLVDILFVQLANFDSLNKHVFFTLRNRRIQRIIDTAKDSLFRPQNLGQLEILNANEEAMKKLLFRFTLFVSLFCITSAVSPILTKAFGQEAEFLAYYPFDTNGLLGFSIAITFSTLTLTFEAYCTVTLDSTVVLCYCQAKTQLQALRYNLENLVDLEINRFEDKATNRHYKDNATVQKRLEHCVKHYQQINWFAREVESTFSEPITVQFLIQSWVICMTVYKLAALAPGSSEFINTVSYLVIILLQLFLYCYFGTQLNAESELVTQSVYNGNWTELSPKFRRQLVILMSCTGKPIIPCAAKIVPITLETFVAIIKASYSLYTILDTTSG